jgi:hypothetical protein|tara:strand:+ start:4086 stop:4343 length:258 start_codon:yes stop_codon:yes gene_type:complete
MTDEETIAFRRQVYESCVSAAMVDAEAALTEVSSHIIDAFQAAGLHKVQAYDTIELVDLIVKQGLTKAVRKRLSETSFSTNEGGA